MRFGKLIGTIAALGVLAGIMPSGASAADACGLKLIASLPAILTKDREILVPVSINGTELKFLLSTGTTGTSLQAHVAEKLGLSHVDVAGVSYYGPHGELSTERTNVHEFNIGGNVAHDFGMLLIQEEPGKPSDYDGILGAKFLWNFDLEVDLAAGKVNLFSKEHCPGKVLYWADSGLAAPFHKGIGDQADLRVLLNGKEFGAILESASPDTFISWRVAHDLDIHDDTAGLVSVDIPNGSGVIHASKFHLDSIEFGGEKYANFPIIIGAHGVTAPAGPGSNLREHDFDSEVLYGVQFFIYNRVYIAYDEQKIYFTGYAGSQIKDLYAKMASR